PSRAWLVTMLPDGPEGQGGANRHARRWPFTRPCSEEPLGGPRLRRQRPRLPSRQNDYNDFPQKTPRTARYPAGLANGQLGKCESLEDWFGPKRSTTPSLCPLAWFP